MILKKIKNNKGFVLLFTVTLAAIFLSIALGIGQIALKENNFSTSAVDTNNAFFAADTGLECALFYDDPNETRSGTVFTHPSNPSFKCNNVNIFASESTSVWTFIVSGLGSTGQACSIVKVDKATSPPLTIVTADGYNLGGSSCTKPPNAVDRELTTTY
jgi:Tfp pilus assembly protein PilX